jgi:cytochrome c oxidase assembly protein subunit 15
VLNFGLWASMAHQTAAQLIFGSLVFATTVAFWRANANVDAAPAHTASPSRADD